MARKKKSRSGKSKALPLLILAPVGMAAYESIKAGMDTKNPVEVMYPFTGYGSDGQMHYDRLAKTWVPIGLGIVGHRLAGKHINRYIPKWIPVKL